MNQIVPYSDSDILFRVSTRRGLYKKINQRKRTLRKQAIDAFLVSKVQQLQLDATVLDDPESKKAFFRAFKKDFVMPDISADGALVQFESAAENTLSANVSSESWTVGDCGCVLQRVYILPMDSQTFHAVPCSNHAGLNNGELHDTIEEETIRRGSFHRYLIEVFGDRLLETDSQEMKSGVNIEFRWEGTSPSLRKVIGKITGITISPGEVISVNSWADSSFVPGSVVFEV